MYQEATMYIKVDEETYPAKLPIHRVLKQDDSESPKLFNLALENNSTGRRKVLNIDKNSFTISIYRGHSYFQHKC